MFRRAISVILLLAFAAAAAAQEHHHPTAEPAAPGWTWSADANVFVGGNYQQRKFTDFHAVESQNWAMLDVSGPLGPGTFGTTAMISLEPFTLHDIGSPQVFQTGETFGGAPLIDYQHPHDLVMAAGVSYALAARGFKYTFGADLVGAPALGPTAFMHRDSARDNPQAPLTHHQMDSTHITPGVVTAGAGTHGVTIEASAFRGAEPDEDRTDIDQPKLDSWSTRVSWRRGSWSAQASGGRLHHPEPFEPYDVTRLTASIGFDGSIDGRPLAATLAWGENRHPNGIEDGYLLEWDYRRWVTGTIFGRAELTAKEILTLGAPDPPGFTHVHDISHIGALTIGFVRELAIIRAGRIGVGGDATVYAHSADLDASYGSPHSFHVFVRYRAR